ncbi:MAG: lysine--tRNA ligase [Thermodesulfobacteriota bacterium]|nr:lysine--tRNA ligase [Thermodesulfobacteriota bacterium]
MEKKETSVIEKRREKINALKAEGIDLFPATAEVSHTVAQVLAAVEHGEITETDDAPILSMAGRIMAVNSFGKSAFIRLKDRTGVLQAYLQKNKLGDAAYALFKQIDIGDFVGLKGTMFQTKTGEWTLLAEELRLLCKAVRPLPEKFHGLKDPEKRYRQRYLDLIMNVGSREIFIKRSRIIQAVRAFLLERDFLEVETPMMQPIPGGAEARPFVTHHNALDMDLFLRIAPELYLKRLVVGGFERVFEINRNFRNEGISTRHNPEFTMLEFYQAYADYRHLMAMTEDLFGHVVMNVCNTMTVEYQGNTIDFSKPWRRMTLMDAMQEIAGIDNTVLADRDALLSMADQKGVKITKADNRGKIITKLFDALVEPFLISPTFITGYPKEVSPLSRTNAEDPAIVDRFELFIAGSEIANGFSELNDPEDQKARFLAQVNARAAGDDEAHFMDEDYVEALEYGLPPTAGEGIGIDRLVMLLTDASSIREVILFPHMRPESGK